MNRQEYQLDGSILTSNEDLTLCRSDKASLEISRGTLAVGIKNEQRNEGYIFLGHGRLLVDTIVETEKGAFGKSVEKELAEPFLMIGSIEETSEHLVSASSDDFKRMDLNEKEFLDKANNMLKKLSGRPGHNDFECSGKMKGIMFVFPDGEDRLETLILKGSKLVYTTKDLSFISSEDKSILKSSGQVVLSTHGRSLIVEKPSMCRFHC